MATTYFSKSSPPLSWLCLELSNSVLSQYCLRKWWSNTGLNITKRLVIKVEFKMKNKCKMYLKKTSKIFFKRKKKRILHISMKLVWAFIYIGMFVSSDLTMLGCDLLHGCIALVSRCWENRKKMCFCIFSFIVCSKSAATSQGHSQSPLHFTKMQITWRMLIVFVHTGDLPNLS